MMPLLATAESSGSSFFIFITLLLLSVVAVSLLLSQFKQSLMGGYFLCGVILGNISLLSEASHAENIHVLSEIGVILLMFTLGIEFSLDELKQLRRYATIAGSIQMSICTLIFGLGAYFLNFPLITALVLGSIVAISSTAVALKSFQEAKKTGTPAAKMALGVALFQDIFSILLMAILPQLLLPGQSAYTMISGIGVALVKGLLFLLIAGLIGKYILPKILNAVAQTRSHELFTISVIAFCACITLLSGMMDLSLALGAFVAGAVVSGSYYSHRVLSEIMPFRDLFLTIFFVSAGLLVKVDTLIAYYNWILLSLLACIVFKVISCLIAAKALKMTGSMATLASFALANVGEFALVLMASTTKLITINPELIQCLYAVVALSMGLTPSLMKIIFHYTTQLDGWKWFHKHHTLPEHSPLSNTLQALSGHAIICGYGPIGQHLHKRLLQAKIPCVIVDLNAKTIRQLLNNGTPAILGDIRHHETLKLLHIDKAELIAFTFPDSSAPMAAYSLIQELNPQIKIIARAKFKSETEALWNMGITSIIYDEHETAEAMTKQAMTTFAPGLFPFNSQE